MRTFLQGLAVLFLCASPAWGLTWAIPQPKPCPPGTYWDSLKVHQNVARWPGVIKYIATPEYVLAQLESKRARFGGTIVEIPIGHEHTHDAKGCYVLNIYAGGKAEPFLGLLTRQGDA